MTSAEFIELGQQIVNLHRRRVEDAPGCGGASPLRSGQATIERLPDNGGDGCAALPRQSAHPLVAFIVDENLQPVRQHAHTLACACASNTGSTVRHAYEPAERFVRIEGLKGSNPPQLHEFWLFKTMIII